MVSGKVRVSTVDQDHQEVVVDEPAAGAFFGFASMLAQTPHQTGAIAIEEATCLEVSRDDIAHLLERKPLAGMDLLTTLGHQFHAAQELVRLRASRNPNEVIEEQSTLASESLTRSRVSAGPGSSLTPLRLSLSSTRRSISSWTRNPGTRIHSSCSIYSFP